MSAAAQASWRGAVDRSRARRVAARPVRRAATHRSARMLSWRAWRLEERGHVRSPRGRANRQRFRRSTHRSHHLLFITVLNASQLSTCIHMRRDDSRSENVHIYTRPIYRLADGEVITASSPRARASHPVVGYNSSASAQWRHADGRRRRRRRSRAGCPRRPRQRLSSAQMLWAAPAPHRAPSCSSTPRLGRCPHCNAACGERAPWVGVGVAPGVRTRARRRVSKAPYGLIIRRQRLHETLRVREQPIRRR